MLDRQMASIIKFTLERARNPNGDKIRPYYNEVPEGFVVPSVYFPPVEVSSAGDTFASFALEYVWFIKFFHVNTPLAQELALSVLSSIRSNRNLISLINDDSGDADGGGFRVRDPMVKKVDLGVFQMEVSWRSLRPYDVSEAEWPGTGEKMMVRNIRFT